MNIWGAEKIWGRTAPSPPYLKVEMTAAPPPPPPPPHQPLSLGLDPALWNARARERRAVSRLSHFRVSRLSLDGLRKRKESAPTLIMALLRIFPPKFVMVC